MFTTLLTMVAVLAVASVAFGVVEARWPGSRGQVRFREGWLTDVAWYFFSPISRFLASAAVILAVVGVAVLAGVPLDGEAIRAFATRNTFISAQPVALQSIELLFLLDLIGYWSHRAFHRQDTLWAYHSVHHSSNQLDWLSSVRVHPVNEIGTRIVQAVPLVLVGFNAKVIAAYVPLLTVYAIFLHANVPWSYGPLRYVIASPVFHRWHHTSEEEGLDRNFSGMFPLFDVVFGTLYLPKARLPKEFGVLGEDVPSGLIPQLLYPFRRRRVPMPETRIA